jgi:hypothetical protein
VLPRDALRQRHDPRSGCTSLVGNGSDQLGPTLGSEPLICRFTSSTTRSHPTKPDRSPRYHAPIRGAPGGWRFWLRGQRLDGRQSHPDRGHTRAGTVGGVLKPDPGQVALPIDRPPAPRLWLPAGRNAPRSPGELAQLLLAHLDDLGYRRAVLLGHSRVARSSCRRQLRRQGGWRRSYWSALPPIRGDGTGHHERPRWLRKITSAVQCPATPHAYVLKLDTAGAPM